MSTIISYCFAHHHFICHQTRIKNSSSTHESVLCLPNYWAQHCQYPCSKRLHNWLYIVPTKLINVKSQLYSSLSSRIRTKEVAYGLTNLPVKKNSQHSRDLYLNDHIIESLNSSSSERDLQGIFISNIIRSVCRSTIWLNWADCFLGISLRDQRPYKIYSIQTKLGRFRPVRGV